MTCRPYLHQRIVTRQKFNTKNSWQAENLNGVPTVQLVIWALQRKAQLQEHESRWQTCSGRSCVTEMSFHYFPNLNANRMPLKSAKRRIVYSSEVNKLTTMHKKLLWGLHCSLLVTGHSKNITWSCILTWRFVIGQESILIFHPTNCKQGSLIISNFRHVLYVVCFLLGNSPASEFYMLTFRNTLSVPSS